MVAMMIVMVIVVVMIMWFMMMVMLMTGGRFLNSVYTNCYDSQWPRVFLLKNIVFVRLQIISYYIKRHSVGPSQIGALPGE